MIETKTQSSLFARQDTQILKGIAIIGVVIIHSLTTIPASFYDQNLTSYLLILVDQSVRFAVPMFVLLSGYGLAKSYSQQSLNFHKYLRKRLSKVIPIFLLWSAYLWWIIGQFDQWQASPIGNQWWHIFVLGQADYHLYFIPMLIQLYLLFPLLNLLRNRWLLVLTILTLGIQVWLYYHANTWDFTDQEEIVNGLAWLGYFCFGILAAKLKFKPTKIFAISLTVIGFSVLAWHSISLFQTTQELTLAMESTKWSVIGYSIGLFYLSSYLMPVLRKIKALRWVGGLSFVIYVSHTGLLRFLQAPLTLSQSIFFLSSYILMIFISVYLFTPYLKVLFRRIFG